MDVRTEKILLARISDGDETGFGELMAAHSPRLLSLAWRLTGNREDAEDIVQEAFLRLHRSLGRFRGDSSVATWLYRTTTRLAIDQMRRRKLRDKIFFFRRDSEEPDPVEIAADSDATPAERLLASETRRLLKRTLQGLSPRQQAVFKLRHYEGLPLREIALLLELEEGTVKAHLHRAVAFLRQAVKKAEEETS